MSFQFVRAGINGWSVWKPLVVPLDHKLVIVYGTNGSGKTTFVDVIRQILDAKRLSMGRRPRNYITEPGKSAVLWAVIKNEGVDGKPPPFATEGLLSPTVTLACAILPETSNGREKRFIILPGEPDFDKIRQAFFVEKKEWDHARYVRALERAGISRSHMKVLAIEQGRVNELNQLAPRELFERIVDMVGEKDTLERYNAALKKVQAAAEEIQRQTGSLGVHETRLAQLKQERLDLERYAEQEKRVLELRRKLPAAKLQRVLKELRDASSQKQGLETKARDAEVERQRLEREIAIIEGRLATAKSQIHAAEAAAEDATNRRDGAREAQQAVAADVKRLDEIQKKLEGWPPQDLDELARQVEEEETSWARSKAQLDSKQTELSTTLAQVEALERGLTILPAAVAATLTDLRQRKLPFQLLADLVEPAPEAPLHALEAAMGDARYALVVPRQDHSTVQEIARQHGHPGPIYAGDQLAADFTHPFIRFKNGAPAWIGQWLETVRLNPDGQWEDARGTWVRPAQELVLGEGARRETLQRLIETRAGLEETIRALTKATLAQRAKADAARKAAEDERTRREMAREVEALPRLREESLQRNRAFEEVDGAWRDAQASVVKLHESRAKDDTNIQRLRPEQDKIQRELDGFLGGARKLGDLIPDLERQRTELRPQCDPDLLSDAEKGAFPEDPRFLESNLKSEENILARLNRPPDSIIQEEARLSENVLRIRTDLERHASSQKEADEELREWMKRYVDMVESSLREYKKRLAEIVPLANARVALAWSRLDPENLESLVHAEVYLSFAYDDKDLLNIGHEDFSGGQRVLNSLLVLVAMARMDRQGFLVLDEPYADLSIDRIEEVRTFFRNVGCQFIITVPTTGDPEKYEGDGLQIVLRKKPSGEKHAPEPIILST